MNATAGANLYDARWLKLDGSKFELAFVAKEADGNWWQSETRLSCDM